jgi:hypothetical protein
VDELAVRLKSVAGRIPADDHAGRQQLAVVRTALASYLQVRSARTGAPATRRPPQEPGPRTDAQPDAPAEPRVQLALALHDPFSIAIRVLFGRGGETVAMAVDRVLARTPFCVAWLTVDRTELAQDLAGSGWTLWQPDSPVEARKRAGVVGADQLPVHRVLVATLRHDDIAEFARLTTARAVHLAGRSTDLVVRADECSGEEYRRRSDVLEAVVRRRQHSTGGSTGPQLARCAGCGRPLTDPTSARRGYGPVCCGEATGSRRRSVVPADGPGVFPVAGIPLADWQARLRRELAVRTTV